MPFDGSGNYNPPSSPTFPAVGGQVISATYYNSVINDIATALSNTLTRDGQGKPSVNINWNAKNLSNVADLSVNGTIYAGAGGYKFTADASLDTGFDWASEGVINVRCNNTVIGTFSSTGFSGTAANATLAATATNALALGGLARTGFAELTGATFTGAVGVGGDLSVFGNILLANTNPTVTFNTGGPQILVPGIANTIAIRTSGVERFRVTSSGNVGVGTAAPATTFHVLGDVRIQNVGVPTLQLNGTDITINAPAANTLAFTTSGVERARLNNVGHLGINNTTPGYSLDVASLDTTAGVGYALRLRANSTANGVSVQFTDSGVTEQRGVITVNSTEGIFQLDGSRVLRLRTSSADRLIITAAGNVGINNGSPGDRLSVGGAISDSLGNVRRLIKAALTTGTLTAAEANMLIRATGGVTVPNAVFAANDSVVILNKSGGNITITQGASLTLTDTNGATGNRTLANHGIATVWFNSSGDAVIFGTGLS